MHNRKPGICSKAAIQPSYIPCDENSKIFRDAVDQQLHVPN
jgi:hypothetical protein